MANACSITTRSTYCMYLSTFEQKFTRCFTRCFTRWQHHLESLWIKYSANNAQQQQEQKGGGAKERRGKNLLLLQCFSSKLERPLELYSRNVAVSNKRLRQRMEERVVKPLDNLLHASMGRCGTCARSAPLAPKIGLIFGWNKQKKKWNKNVEDDLSGKSARHAIYLQFNYVNKE